jgi:oligopeptide/dipeptide ABC transporter ATP-binding protein
MGRFGTVSVGLVILLAVFGPPLFGDAAARIDLDAIGQSPSLAHWFGTDALGRDILLRVLVASRLSLILSVVATVIGVVVGLGLGSVRSLFGPIAGRIAGAPIAISQAFPSLLLVLFFAATFGVSTRGSVLAIGLAIAPFFARLAQTLTASVEAMDYVAAARICGVGRVGVLTHHILPNVAEPLLLNIALTLGGVILSFAGLSFLGIGIQPPVYDWGALINDGLVEFYVNPMAAIGPGMVVCLAGVGFNFLAEALSRGKITLGETPPLTASPEEPFSDADPSMADPGGAVLVLRDLRVSYPGPTGPVTPVRGVGFAIEPGQAVGLIGESGSGKSQTALAIAQLIETPASVTWERLDFGGKAVADMDEPDRNRLFGTAMAMVFQNPMSSFNPARRLGVQIADGARRHQQLGRRDAAARVVERLRQVGIRDAQRRASDYPHQFSGGMRQRAMIAMGLMGAPRLIIADEPTTALDASTQTRVLDLLARIRTEQQAALLLISHDLGVVQRICDRLIVMYAGRIVEDLPVAMLPHGARHPYSRALLATVPSLDVDRSLPLATIDGWAPSPADTVAGCAFVTRCGHSLARCRVERPMLEMADDGHRLACWNPQGETTGARSDG